MSSLRPITPRDLDIVCHHRDAMFEDMAVDPRVRDEMREGFRDWVTPRLADGRYFGFLLEDAGAVVAGVGLFLLDWPPHPWHPAGQVRGYVTNVFVEAAYRGQGLARQLMAAAEAELVRRGVGFVVLHASDSGRRLYEQLGWTATTELSKSLTPR